jgi:hypothetical protein
MTEDEMDIVEPLVNESEEYSATAENAARNMGMLIQRPNPTQLLLDFDNSESYFYFLKKAKELGFTNFYERFSKSGYPHRHVIVNTGLHLTDWQRLAYQAVLGSDPVRAFLDVRYMHENGKTDTCLFVKKDE